MTTGRRRPWILIMLAGLCAGLGPGCAQSNPLLARRTTIGMLQSSVSQLEIEKANLRTELADVRADQRRLEEQLAQEEAANGELAARLDDARVLLRGRGYDDEELAGPAVDDPFAEPPRTAPAGRTTRPGRKPPFARIPSLVDTPSDDEFPEADDPLDLPPARGQDPFGPQSSRGPGASSWLPVARGGDRAGGGMR